MKRYNEQLRNNAITNLTYKNRGLNMQLAQAEDAYAAKKLNARLEGVKAKGAAMAASSDSGGGGRSLAAIGRTLDFNIERNLATLQDNLEKTRAQTQSQIEFSQANAYSNLQANSQDTSIDYLGAVMKGVSTYAMGAASGASTAGAEAGVAAAQPTISSGLRIPTGGH